MLISLSMSSSKIFNGAWSTTFDLGWKALEHHHPDVWEIILVTQGSVEVHTPERKREGMAGSIFIHPPRVPHWEAVTSAKLKMLGFFVKAPSMQSELPDHLHDVHGRVGHTMEWIYDLQMGHGFDLPVFEDLSRAVLFECGRKANALDDPRMARVRSFVHQSVRENLTVDKLAGVACMSRRHFSREFQRLSQMSPMAYVREVRLHKARQAITQSNLPLRQIALEVGFRDEFEFSRVFRRAMGFAPSALRVKLRK